MNLWLKEKRVAAGLSQRDVAEHMNYSTPQFISNWERDVSVPPTKSIPKLAKLYKIDAQELFMHVKTRAIGILAQKMDRDFKGAMSRGNK